MAIDPFIRKLRYVVRFASVKGIDLTGNLWAGLAEYIHTNIGSNIMFRFLLDMYLTLSAHLDSSKFEFHPLDFTKMAVETWPPRPFIPPKGTIPDEDIERMLWYFRALMATKEGIYYKISSETGRQYMAYLKGILTKYGADPTYADILFELYGLTEGKLPATSLVGVMVVGISKIAPPTYPVRLARDWKTTIDCENKYIYEMHVDIARVGYCRMITLPGSLREETAKHISERISEHIKRQSVIASSPEAIFYPKVFFWQRLDRMHWTGGDKQLTLQRIRNEIKPILDRHGILVQFRIAYLNYAYEIYYFKHKGHEHTKYFKLQLEAADIKDKYVRMGLDEAILNEITTLMTR